jgi:type II secretory ATPase GspE/PulE/Tfp pilus assembly ATPase PilB-like protein
MDMGIENYLVASTLVCVMAQRLVRRICPSCRMRADLPADVLKNINTAISEAWTGGGCEACAGTGYKGRIGIFEVLPVSGPIRELIMKRATIKEMKDKAVELGMRTLREDGIEKVKKGITTIDEVLRVTQVEM